MAALLSYPDCGKAFRNGAAMRKHAQTHAPKGQVPCPHCPKLLKTKDSLRKHFNTKHNNSYEHPHQCPVCDKRFQNRSKMVQHHGTHNADDETAQRAAGRVLGAEVTRLIAQAIRGGSPAEVCHASPTVTCTTCKRLPHTHAAELSSNVVAMGGGSTSRKRLETKLDVRDNRRGLGFDAQRHVFVVRLAMLRALHIAFRIA
jgi:uncharacterized C2H2 Zn-finger protein